MAVETLGPSRGGHTAVILAAGALAWVALNGLAIVLSGGVLPFDRPALAGLPFVAQMALPSVGLIEIFLLMAIVHWLTRRRPVPDIAARAPARALAARETALTLTWAMLAQIGGWLIAHALGYRPFSFHLAGTLVGCSQPPSPGEAFLWAGYNFTAFAVIPYAWFRRRYSNTQLNLRSSAPRNDRLVIVVVATIETLTELAAFPGVLKMTGPQFAMAGPLAFLLFGAGTVLPTMVLIYAILIPRYFRLTGSFVATVLLGGATYALMHLVEGWSNFSSLRDGGLSLIFVILTYVGPGMFKSFVTLRTGNAWVHAIAYHAIAPHVVVDAPLVARVFAIR
ncbi:MAG TPA: hypothetical protein VGG68_11390 [Caulobacteraceae bacterium]